MAAWLRRFHSFATPIQDKEGARFRWSLAWILAASLSIAVGCNSLHGGALGEPDNLLKADVTRMVGMYESAKGGSESPKLVSTQVVGADGSTSIQHWTFDSNGKTVTYIVKLTPSPIGGTDFSIEELEAK